MASDLNPMRWPGAWKDPSALDLLDGTAVNCLVFDDADSMKQISEDARKHGLQIFVLPSQPAGVTVVKGEWPGVKLNQSGHMDRASAGPTGVPWIDSNGWRIRLTAQLSEGNAVWVDTDAPKMRRPADSYLIAIADAAAHGGRWIVSVDDQLAAGIAARKPDSLETWKKLTGAVTFFAKQGAWAGYFPEGVMGIISDFSGRNEFLSHELLNLISRTNQQYLIFLKSKVSQDSFSRLKAVTYTDDERPAEALRQQILAFVEQGGMLITGPSWGPPPGEVAQREEHPRYELRKFGKGRVAIARPDFEDPYLLANDSVVLISHRYELLRFWNGGAVGSYVAMPADRRRALVQLLFYAFVFANSRPSVRVAGRYKSAKIMTLQHPDPRVVEMEVQENAVELHLPAVSGYAALDLEAQSE
jgi:hypothetical protein